MSTTIDSSAAAWAEATLAAAEAYAIENASVGNPNNDSGGQGGGGPTDGVDRTSSEQRALDAFWSNDPNRPASTLPGGGSTSSTGGGGGGDPVELTAAEVEAIRNAGSTVTPTGDGRYVIDAGVESIKIVEQAPPPPPPIVILPTYPSTTGGPDAGTTPPPAQTNPDGGAPKVNDAGTPAEPEKVDKTLKTGLGAEADKILNMSPTLQKEWAALQDKGWKVRFGEAGKGSYADRNSVPPTIVMDPNLKSNPALMAETFAHEVGHAGHTLAPEVGMGGKTREQYVDQNLDRHLDDEGAANFRNAQARDEIHANGGPKGFGFSGTQDVKYQQIYDDYKAGKITEQQAIHQMGQAFADGEKTSTTKQTYRDYYSDQYEKKWDAAHPAK